MAINNSVSGTLEVMSNEGSLAYPSCNAINGGEINSEENIRNIVNRISTKSFVIKRTDDSVFDIYSNDSNIIISSGEANISGYYYRNTRQTIIDLNSYLLDTSSFIFDIYTNWDKYVYIDTSTGVPITTNIVRLYVYLTVKKDSADHILAYNAEDNVYSNFKGVVVALTNDPDNNYDLLLGYVDVVLGNNSLSVIHSYINANKYLSLDADVIYQYNSSTQTIYTLYDIIQQYITNNKSFKNDIVVFGPTPSNSHGTSNIYLCGNNSETAIRIYYDNNQKGGIALCMPEFDDDGNIVGIPTIVKELITFDNLNTTDINTAVSISLLPNSDYINDVNIEGNINISNSNIISVTTQGTGEGSDWSNDSVNINSSNINIKSGATTVGRRVNINIGDINNFEDANINISGQINLPSTEEGSTSTVITNDIIQANKVYGAVWA